MGLITLIIGIALLVLLVYHWDLIDTAFVTWLESITANAFPYNYLEQPNFYEYQYDRYLYKRMIYPSWMPTYTPYWLYEDINCYCGTGDRLTMYSYDDNYDWYDNQIAEVQLDDIYTPTQRDANFMISGTSNYYNSIWSTYYGYD